MEQYKWIRGCHSWRLTQKVWNELSNFSCLFFTAICPFLKTEHFDAKITVNGEIFLSKCLLLGLKFISNHWKCFVLVLLKYISGWVRRSRNSQTSHCCQSKCLLKLLDPRLTVFNQRLSRLMVNSKNSESSVCCGHTSIGDGWSGQGRIPQSSVQT